MGEFIFWVILIPLLFYIIISTFSKENVLKEKETHQQDDHGDK